MRRKIQEMLFDLFFTPNGTCPICGRVLFGRKKYLCEKCYEDLPVIRIETCEQCGRPMAGRGKCKNCMKTTGTVQDGGLVWLDYDVGAKTMIAGMKFSKRQGLCIYAGRQMAKLAVQQPWIGLIDAIIPVPIHENRYRERGYNQSDLIACGLSRGIKEAIDLDIPIEELLYRKTDTPHQVGKNRSDRLQNPLGAFEAQPGYPIVGRTFLLIDDVMTTGSTLQACIRVLKERGAAAVYTAVCAAAADYSRA